MSEYAIDTTKVLKESSGKSNIYYIPGFFRLKVKNFT